jgi:hypothetical protein
MGQWREVSSHQRVGKGRTTSRHPLPEAERQRNLSCHRMVLRSNQWACCPNSQDRNLCLADWGSVDSGWRDILSRKSNLNALAGIGHGGFGDTFESASEDFLVLEGYSYHSALKVRVANGIKTQLKLASVESFT